MAELRRRLKRGLAGFLALCMTITSFTGISWADENISYDVSVKLEGAGIWKAAQEAITNGTEIPLGEELDESDTETARFYGLFAETGNKGSVFEMALDYEYETGEDEDVPDGADFSAFVRTKKHLTEEEAANYKITGEEQIIFLFYNYSEAVLRYQLHIDEQFTSKIRVNKYEMKLETEGPGLEQNKTPGGAGGQTPEAGSDVTLPAEGTVQTPEETTVPEETTAAPEESTSAAPEETLAPAPEETLAPETTTAPDETSSTAENTDAAPVETPAPSPEETTASTPEETKNPAEEPSPVPEDPQTSMEDLQNTDSNDIKNPAEESSPVPEEPEDPSEDANETLSMSRNNAFTLMAASPDSEMEAATASQINPTASPSNGEKIKGEIVKRDTFDEDGYNVTVFAVTLKDIPKVEKSNYKLLIEHDLAYGGKIYYDEQTVALSEDAFDENLVYNFSNDVYESETYHKGGLLLKTPEEELKVSKDSFVYNEETANYEAKVIVDYGLQEGWQVVDDKIEEVKPISYYQRRARSTVEKQPGIQTVNTSYVFPESLTPQEYSDQKHDNIEPPNMSFITHDPYAPGEVPWCKAHEGESGYDDWFWPKDHHYVFLECPPDEDVTSFAGYLRCDLYEKLINPPPDPDVQKRVVTFTLEGESEVFATLLVYEKNGWKPLQAPAQYTGKNEELKGETITYWYRKGQEDIERNRLTTEELRKIRISKPQEDFIGVIVKKHVYYRNDAKSETDFVAPFGDKIPIKDETSYGSINNTATIKGEYNKYWHDNSHKHPLIGWTEGLKGEIILNTKEQYENFIKNNSFYKFGEQIIVDRDYKLYPVWGSSGWSKITINYEVDSKHTDFGNIDRKMEELYITETPKGSTATPNDGYEFEGWYEYVNGRLELREESSIIIPEPRSATYIAKFKETTPVTITYEAVNGTIVEPTVSYGTHSQKVNPVTGKPKGVAKPISDAYEFSHWENSRGERVSEDWLSTNAKGENVISPRKDAESGKFVSDTYTAYYRLKSNGSLTIGKELSGGSISLEGLDENQIPSFEMIIILKGVGDAVISIPEGAVKKEYTANNAPKDFDVKKDREYHIFVKVGESVVFGDIPRNVSYTVKEDESSSTYYQSKLTEIVKNSDIKLSSNPVTGEFVSKASQNVVFYNKVDFAMMDNSNPVRIEKWLDQDFVEPVDNLSFVFKIENVDKNSPKYGEVFYTTIYIEAGKQKGEAELRSLPVSKAYRITEESHMRYTCSPGWYKVEIGTGANDGKPKYYIEGAGEDAGVAKFINIKTTDAYFSDSYMLVNKMNVEGTAFVDADNGNSYPGSSPLNGGKNLLLQPHAMLNSKDDDDGPFGKLDDGTKAFSGNTKFGL